MPRVQMLRNAAGPRGAYLAGEYYEVSADDAKAWLAAGAARDARIAEAEEARQRAAAEAAAKNRRKR